MDMYFIEILSKYNTFHSRKCIGKYRLRNGGLFVQGEDELTYLGLATIYAIANSFAIDLCNAKKLHEPTLNSWQLCP